MDNAVLTGLIKKFKNGDMTAFAIIYEEYKRLIIYYSKRLGGEDYSQEMTVFLIELLYGLNLERFGTSSQKGVGNYIAVALRNKYIALGKQKKKYEVFLNDIYEKDFESSSANGTDIELRELLQLLSKRQQLVITYFFIYGYSEREVSRILNISPQAVNRLKNRALTTLKGFYLD